MNCREVRKTKEGSRQDWACKADFLLLKKKTFRYSLLTYYMPHLGKTFCENDPLLGVEEEDFLSKGRAVEKMKKQK